MHLIAPTIVQNSPFAVALVDGHMLAQGAVLQQVVAAVGEGVTELTDESGEQAEHAATLDSDRLLGPHRSARGPLEDVRRERLRRDAQIRPVLQLRHQRLEVVTDRIDNLLLHCVGTLLEVVPKSPTSRS